ncbi:maleylpyruvate isomerase family mycothiol-dependent enzyme [Nocardioides rubriscoriae]|uniref:maleylpyruvate isomerase family mycothiol-dependent enzyme n=1 Tax=Nocardioides rubriscoriae TaxID=642762 RepID=UPI0014791EB2|nr:maleylpyruvate isomerase family mycothiol-dependent enzyme [Nocardioides rubriscoriae]
MAPPDAQTDAQPGTRPDPLQVATDRLLRAVDALDDAAYAGPSLLPGWSRAHVVAHLALNAEALAGVLHGVIEGRPVAMYPGAEARDHDIDVLAAATPGALRFRLHAATAAFADAVTTVPEDRLGTVVERTPGSDRTFPAGAVGSMRLHEVEIHHADLAIGYTAADWSPDFAVRVVDRFAPQVRATLVATDAGRTWEGGTAAPTVSGTAAALGWWLTGRGEGDGLTSDGELPGIEAW